MILSILAHGEQVPLKFTNNDILLLAGVLLYRGQYHHGLQPATELMYPYKRLCLHSEIGYSSVEGPIVVPQGVLLWTPDLASFGIHIAFEFWDSFQELHLQVDIWLC